MFKDISCINSNHCCYIIPKMPRSKRNRVVSLTKTAPKGRSLKTKYISLVHDALDEYDSVYVFSYENMRAGLFKDVRMEWRESRFFLGKNTISRIALGRTPEDEYKDNLRHVSEKIESNCGLLFTNRKKKETLKYFKAFKRPEYGKAGTIVNRDIVIPPGPLKYPVTMLDQFRKLGLVVEVDNGVMMLREPFVAASKGIPLSPEQAKVLVHQEIPVDEFKVKMLCMWSDGEFQEL